jgi:hypothetical protein
VTTANEVDDQSLGELVATLSRDMSMLVHKEIELAKTELAVGAKRVGFGAGLLGGSGIFGVFGLVFLSVAAAFGIAALGVSLGYAFLAVAGAYLLPAGGLAMFGVRKLMTVKPPERTIRTVRDDITWLRHPTVAPDPQLEELRATHTN